MKHYETIIILNPDTGRETWEEVSGRMMSQIEKEGGFHLKTDDWGSLKLAYEIRKKTRGHYYRVEFCAPGKIIKEMERYFRLDEKVMRFLTVLINENPDVEQLKRDLEEEAEKQVESEIEETPESPEVTEISEAEEAKSEPEEAE
ncbi:MAG: 30S ribosomal protein S6 [Deltaproteobacteria bacterium]|nr:MAG: 30S ribosomal protein S6 [Deltaproteobacteria bacterium]